ncbi:MAG: hypothetical protein ACR2IN_04060 [Thermoleophilaceae bacterium]
MLENVPERVSVDLAERTSRRSFVGRLGMGVVALTGGPLVAAALDPDLAEAHHICGHTGTTGSCPHPFRPASRIDRYGRPLHPRKGYKVDDHGRRYTSSRQPRHKVCSYMVREKYGIERASFGGGWSRCCFGRVRRIYDCCASVRYRINGDRANRGYCGSRRVFCIAYRRTSTRC